jgi:hypothetical protein
MTVTIPSYDVPIYVLGTDRNFWLETGPFKQNGPIPPGRTQVDSNVLDFESIDENNVYVLRTDGNLWRESAPWGQVPPGKPVAGDVVGFDGLAVTGRQLMINSKPAVYVLYTNGDLWLVRFEETPPIAAQVDGKVIDFAAIDENNVYVLGSDRKLWLENAPFGGTIPPHRAQVDGDVLDFEALDGGNIYVLGTDRNLWLEYGPFLIKGPIPPSRTHIDGNVRGFQATPGSDVFVLGTDNNLWLEFPSYGPQNRAHVDGNVEGVQSLGSVDNVLVLGTDKNLWYEQGPFLTNGPVPPPRIQIDGNVLDYSDTNLNRG